MYISMSIATLKRKSNNLHGSYHSKPGGGFSLNGPQRNLSYVGENLSKHYARTIFKGDTARGHGGCCGTYKTTPTVRSDAWTTEDASTVKSSVLNTMGMIRTKYRWITRPYPYAVVGNQKVAECCTGTTTSGTANCYGDIAP